MKKYINIDTWNRREHFHFFKSLEDPFFGLTVDVDFTSVYRQAKEQEGSFFLYSLHTIMRAANATENFRYRLEGDQVVCYDTIHPSCTIGRDDDTFGFSFFEYADNRDTFVKDAKIEIERIKNGSGLMITDDTARMDLIHYSSIPWISFTSLKHARSLPAKDSIPKISTGKCAEKNKRFIMPVSITAHHALMDGLNIARFLDVLNDCIASGLSLYE